MVAKAAGRRLGRPLKMNGQQITEARSRLAGDEPVRLVARAHMGSANVIMPLEIMSRSTPFSIISSTPSAVSTLTDWDFRQESPAADRATGNEIVPLHQPDAQDARGRPIGNASGI